MVKTMKTLKMRVIEKNWKECSSWPFREFRRQEWYEMKWFVYTARWVRSKAAMIVKYPFMRTVVDFSSGYPMLARNRTGIVWQQEWMKEDSSGLHESTG